MFSGIIKNRATVIHVTHAADGVTLVTAADLFADSSDPIRLGESIAHDGVCLTVVEAKENQARFDVSAETLRCTTLSNLRPGALVNVERSLRFGERVDGHFVQGHVEAIGAVREISTEGTTTTIRIGFPSDLRPMIAAKGSIAVDGVSLTIGEVTEDCFSVYVIPTTKFGTTIEFYEPGTMVNLESDCLARYVCAALRSMPDTLNRKVV